MEHMVKRRFEREGKKFKKGECCRYIPNILETFELDVEEKVSREKAKSGEKNEEKI
jgi:hypothetical protein